MVEAVGIEPTSGNAPQQTLHAYLVSGFPSQEHSKPANRLRRRFSSKFLATPLEKPGITKSPLNRRPVFHYGQQKTERLRLLRSEC